jgi:hypothetical protein
LERVIRTPWKKQYSPGKFNNEPIEETALKDWIE